MKKNANTKLIEAMRSLDPERGSFTVRQWDQRTYGSGHNMVLVSNNSLKCFETKTLPNEGHSFLISASITPEGDAYEYEKEIRQGGFVRQKPIRLENTYEISGDRDKLNPVLEYLESELDLYLHR